jgi:hypothetical protein
MSDLKSIGSFSPAERQLETCKEEDAQKLKTSDAPLDETKAATPNYDQITPGVIEHLAKQIQGQASTSSTSSSASNSATAGVEKSGPQAASDWLLNQGKLTLQDAGRQAMVQPGTVTTLQAAADGNDSPTKQNFVGGPPSPSPLGPTQGGSTGGTFDANFQNWSSSVVSGFQAAQAGYQSYQQSQQTQGGPPQGAPPALDLLPSGGGDRPPSSQGQLGDFTDPSSPESTAGNQDDPGTVDPGTPDDPNGPTATAYNPEGDYGRGGGLPGVMGPGVASYDPEAGGTGSGGSGVGAVNVPGFKDPRGGVGMPNPEGDGPIGPASLGMDKLIG